MDIKKILETLPVTVFLIVFLSLGIGLWKIGSHAQHSASLEESFTTLELITRGIENYTQTQISNLKSIQTLVFAQPNISQTDLLNILKETLPLWKGFNQISLLSEDAVTLWRIQPRTTPELPTNPSELKIAADKEQILVAESLKTREVVLSTPSPTQKEISLYVSLPFQTGNLSLKGVLDSATLVRTLFSNSAFQKYTITLSDNGEIIYQNTPYTVSSQDKTIINTDTLPLHNRRWNVELGTLNSESIRTPYWYFTAWAGFGFLLILLSSVFFWFSRKTKKMQLQEKQTHLETIKLFPYPYCEIDKQYTIHFANELFLEAFSITSEKLLSRLDFTAFLKKDDRFLARNAFSSLSKNKRIVTTFLEMRKNQEQSFPSTVTLLALFDDNETLIGYRCLLKDISKERELENQLKQLTYYDELTGLPNKTLFRELLSQEISKYQRTHHPIALLMIDIDRFKLINEVAGYAGGDFLLKTVTERLVAHLRLGDTLARLSSDEFALILSHPARNEEGQGAAHGTQVVARKILDHLTKPFLYEGRELFLGANIGIAIYPEDASDLDSLIAQSEAALSYAKEKGKNNYQFYFKEHNTAAVTRLDAEKKLRYALKKHEFELRYLPKYSLKTGHITAVEALISWKTPSHGLLLPNSFLHFAEENGLIVPMGRWVLKTALHQMAEWKKANLPLIKLALNFSVRQLQEDNFLADFQESLSEAMCDPKDIEFEIQEKILLNTKIQTNPILSSLRNLGITVVLDDFGLGFSALGYLQNSPITQVKIDASFIAGIPENPSNMALIEGLISLAHHLNLSVTAEGIETSTQHDFLSEKNCDEAQGFFLCKPLSATELENRLVKLLD